MKKKSLHLPFLHFRNLFLRLHPFRCSQPIPTIVCFFSCCTSVASSIRQMSHHVVVECGIHGQQNTNPANMQCCCSTEAETGFVPTSAQFFAVGTFLILRSPVLDFLVCTSTACQCFSSAVLLPIDPSKNSPSNCHFAFQSSLEFPDLGT